MNLSPKHIYTLKILFTYLNIFTFFSYGKQSFGSSIFRAAFLYFVRYWDIKRLLIRCLVICFLLCLFLSCKAKLIQTQKGIVFLSEHNGVNDFFIDRSPVTVTQLKAFVRATSYQMDVERIGIVGVFNMKTGICSLVTGAKWLHQYGSADSFDNANFPITLISWNDAVAFCKWVGKWLPVIHEFEFTTKEGIESNNQIYQWEYSMVSCGKYLVNAWQGSFPESNTVADGYKYTSQVGLFGINSIGLTDMDGNVWQWAQDWHPEKPGEKAQCGGSFLCNLNECHVFKIGGSVSSTPESSLIHVGFRCVKDVSE